MLSANIDMDEKAGVEALKSESGPLPLGLGSPPVPVTI
jgi:hypothetical protein